MSVERELENHDPKLIHTYIMSKMYVKEQIRALKDDVGSQWTDRI